MEGGIVVFGYADNRDFHIYTQNDMSRAELLHYLSQVIEILQADE
jgi:hypothetical protein